MLLFILLGFQFLFSQCEFGNHCRELVEQEGNMLNCSAKTTALETLFHCISKHRLLWKGSCVQIMFSCLAVLLSVCCSYLWQFCNDYFLPALSSKARPCFCYISLSMDPAEPPGCVLHCQACSAELSSEF